MTIILHQSLKAIIMAFDGTPKESEYIKAHVKKAQCWGFIENLKEIHLYKTKKCTKRDLVELIAHELSHEGETALKSKYGEEFATMNAVLMVRAYDLAHDLIS